MKNSKQQNMGGLPSAQTLRLLNSFRLKHQLTELTIIYC